MSKIDVSQIEIPAYMQKSWQQVVNLVAELSDVPSALIMKVHRHSIEVYKANDSTESPYRENECEPLNGQLYCETVITEQRSLSVPNALKDKEWDDNPDVSLGMIAYHGLPLNWPCGEPFGTICILDNQENAFTPTIMALLDSFRESVESQLTLLYQQYQLEQTNKELRSRVQSRTQDLASLNYSLGTEIDRRKAAEQKVLYQQSHDLGTGFLNRLALIDEAQTLLGQMKSTDHTLAFVHVGFTNGRRLLAKHGYEVFDTVLKEYRKRVGFIDVLHSITARTSTIDLVFALEIDEAQHNLAALCQRLVDIGQSEFFINGQPLHLHAFIGVATSYDADNANLMLKHAGEAMLACKDSGKKYAFYANSNITTPTNNQLESYLLQAVRNDDLTLYFQPKVSPRNGYWLGAEALLRWNHPVLGQVSNDSLIQLAEKNGLIFEVGNYVLRSAIQRAAEWTKYMKDFRVAINVSAVQLRDPNFVDQIEQLLDYYKLNPNSLELEVTESSLIADEFLAGQTLRKLHGLGVTLSLDDFGTGYSSFSYLKKYPFDCIKIDKSFINQISGSEQDKEIIRSIIHVAKKLKLKVVMEGVESHDQEQFILDEGCDYVQGYLYGKPMNSREFENSLISKKFNGQRIAARH
ncbi:putative EAL, GGDEF and GAF domains protein [Vibrio nigripulchritudo SFn27]|uniref:Putative EAL, GGDEF and GAF domains protein n=1 Tax=Vibrio nigripulchritudo TaxID=28173 RepID=U4K6L1_9VIBR|nr:bifunctional diguanylate cyclase/phosphodiesterase [Vibrio nigripulchritudo]CCN81553.1 putative EAL, GGDEF and GAF domains protein [Vibrio nigripulchritudo BLFn1]CCN91650.1 putative EAL, GGDEF and GAF domains protein [Vibrio nigripulchritudo SFn27]CCN96534.1 putative EAL, GGDEF and GAF domains protein [Vibrio nigripulchritudo ENn2]CCO38408.1 putative EAL, GGDEF and GAF domains protein [Vibrio nigripulchritudo SFn135]CCO53865.1 putative EAL, GGDEF and GAF domains protein [Vibrio nigripulchri